MIWVSVQSQSSIEKLHVRLRLEVRREGLTTDQAITSHDANIDTLCQDIQQSSLETCETTRILQTFEHLTFPAPDSPMRAVSFPGAT